MLFAVHAANHDACIVAFGHNVEAIDVPEVVGVTATGSKVAAARGGGCQVTEVPEGYLTFPPGSMTMSVVSTS